MSWGSCFMYYRCPICGMKFKYAVDMIPVFGAQFGSCPDCAVEGELLYDGARRLDDADYFEVED